MIRKKIIITWNGNPGMISSGGLHMSKLQLELKYGYPGHVTLKITCSIQHARDTAVHAMELVGKNYVKKTTCERKIDSKWIEGRCPCSIQIKMYPHTDTILGRYNPDHSHPVGKDNLRYIRIRVSTRALIEDWVHYGVTDLEIVSDPLFDPD